MMMHAPILPILIPFVTAILMLAVPARNAGTQRTLALGSVLLGALVAVFLLLDASTGTISSYRLGNWQPPFGIVMVVDRLAALMLVLTSTLAIPALIQAGEGEDRGRHFHPIFQMQLAGLNGAFLTGDLFNLFVFFEILLLASYILLVNGGGAARVKAGVSFVVLNLVGSTVFLISLGLTYGTLGTLNLADMANVLAVASPENAGLVRACFAIMFMVFLLKAAAMPMAFWLPAVYPAAGAAVAMLFAIMTKVGIYALLRVSSVVLDPAFGMTDLLQPWLPVLALATIAVGTLGALAATRFGVVVANLVLISTGTLLYALSRGGEGDIAGLLYYLPHTTLVTGGLFLLNGLIAARRSGLADQLVSCRTMPDAMTMGLAFAVLAIAVSGMPPLSGLLGKLMLMQAAAAPVDWSFWIALLLSGFLVTVTMARAVGSLFWEAVVAEAKPAPQLLADQPARPDRLPAASLLALVLMVAASPLLTVFARPVSDYARATAVQLGDTQGYVDAVLGEGAVIERERRP